CPKKSSDDAAEKSSRLQRDTKPSRTKVFQRLNHLPLPGCAYSRVISVVATDSCPSRPRITSRSTPSSCRRVAQEVGVEIHLEPPSCPPHGLGDDPRVPSGEWPSTHRVPQQPDEAARPTRSLSPLPPRDLHLFTGR